MPGTQHSYRTDAQRYAAIKRRDRAADGAFFYAVRTTQVYCRPSCGARLPLRKNVSFHESARAAEQAGFRACKRCHPQQADGADARAQLIATVCARIDAAQALPTLAQLAADVALSPSHLQRLFKQHMGMSPRQYAAAQRLSRMRSELSQGATVTHALWEAGYGSSSRFYEQESKMLGMSPSALRRGGRGVQVRSAVRGCSLGQVLVAATPRGICAISFGDDAALLERELRHWLPAAQHLPPDPAFEQWVQLVVHMVEHSQLADALPLDLVGTAFQQRVWRALRDIPRGKTVSYAELARRVGLAGGARAVGRACGDNRIAVAVPCHRVLRGDGALGGYRWGLPRKQTLLERERR